MFTYQFKFLLLFALQLFNVFRKVWPVKLMVQLLLDRQHFFGDATKCLRYLMDQLPVVVEVIMGPRPQVGFMSSGRQQKNQPFTEINEVYNSDFCVYCVNEIKNNDTGGHMVKVQLKSEVYTHLSQICLNLFFLYYNLTFLPGKNSLFRSVNNHYFILKIYIHLVFFFFLLSTILWRYAWGH